MLVFCPPVTGNFGNIQSPNSIVSLPCSSQEKYHVLVIVAVASIYLGTDHFCCFAPSPETAFPFALCEENSMLTKWRTSRFQTLMIIALTTFAWQLHARCKSPRSLTWLTMCYSLIRPKPSLLQKI